MQKNQYPHDTEQANYVASPKLCGFVQVSATPSSDLNGTVRQWKHERTGAVLIQLDVEDNHKAFTIGFRTPPNASTGICHIIEHSVLCGSKKFPVKEPFANLMRSSLNTFLNAMTYPDRTLYPFSSQNEKDFLNILDIYIDAVFHPCFYNQEMIFEKEGHHFEISEDLSKLTISGVVYNEMKGAMSDPESLLYEEVSNTLYNNAYAYNSGGDPDVIEQLTYEDFCSYHKEHYHPSNSFSIVYGNIDIEKVLSVLDASFEGFDYQASNFVVPQATCFSETRKIRAPYSATSEDEGSYVSYAFLMPHDITLAEESALKIIVSNMFDLKSSQLRNALLNEGLCESCSSNVEFFMSQGSIIFQLKGVQSAHIERIQHVFDEEFERVAREGFNKKLMSALLNSQAFSLKEDRSMYGMGKGLQYALRLTQPLVMGQDIMESINLSDHINELREKIDTSFYEDTFKKALYNNSSRAWVELYPQPGLLEQKAAEKEEDLERIRKGLTQEQREEIYKHQLELQEYAVTPDTPEEEACLPTLSVSDLKVNVRPSSLESNEHGLYRADATNGICYAQLQIPLFNTQDYSDKHYLHIRQEELPVLRFLSTLFGKLPTAHHNIEELETLSFELLGGGGINVGLQYHIDKKLSAQNSDKPVYRYAVSVGVKYLQELSDKALALAYEIFSQSLFTDEAKISQLLNEHISNFERSLPSRGESIALQRMRAYYNAAGAFSEYAYGIEGYRILCALRKQGITALLEKLNDLHKRCVQAYSYAYVCAEEAQVKDNLTSFAQIFKCSPYEGLVPVSTHNIAEALGARNEGIIIQSEVQYVGQAGSFEENMATNGNLMVLKDIVSNHYLWTNIRLSGGAYGCIHRTLSTDAVIVSYRDPHLKQTYQQYLALPEWISQLDMPQEALDNAIISTYGALNQPETVLDRIDTDFICYITNTSTEDRIDIQKQVLNTRLEDIKNLARVYQHVLEQNIFCVVGSSTKINQYKTCFNDIMVLPEL